MASLLEHVMINKLGDDLNAAILAVGGDTSSVDHIMDYPEIIRNQLVNRNGHECNPDNPDNPDNPNNPGLGDIDINELISEIVNSERFLYIMKSFGDDEGINADILQWNEWE